MNGARSSVDGFMSTLSGGGNGRGLGLGRWWGGWRKWARRRFYIGGGSGALGRVKELSGRARKLGRVKAVIDPSGEGDRSGEQRSDSAEPRTEPEGGTRPATRRSGPRSPPGEGTRTRASGATGAPRLSEQSGAEKRGADSPERSTGNREAPDAQTAQRPAQRPTDKATKHSTHLHGQRNPNRPRASRGALTRVSRPP